MYCTNVRFRTPNNVPPHVNLRFVLNRKGGMLTEADYGEPVTPHQFEDGTWGAWFFAHSRSLLADYVRGGCEVLAGYGYVIVSETDCTPKFSFSGLIEGMCKRPDMYTRHGTFDEVMADLKGFFSGIHLCREAPDEATEALTQWNDFAWVWLRERFSDYQSPLEGLRAAYSDDKAALENLAALWSEYRSTRQH